MPSKLLTILINFPCTLDFLGGSKTDNQEWELTISGQPYFGVIKTVLKCLKGGWIMAADSSLAHLKMTGLEWGRLIISVIGSATTFGWVKILIQKL